MSRCAGWLIDELVAQSITVAGGNTEAPAEQIRTAATRNVKSVTHVFNGMCGLACREAGVAGAPLSVSPGVMRPAWPTTGRDRTIWVTDTNEAARTRPGAIGIRFGRQIHVEGGAVRLDDGTISGGVTTHEQVFANFPCTTRAERNGSLEVRRGADIVLPAHDGEITTTMGEGRRAHGVWG